MVISMEEKRKVPRIRFKGFTDDWEQRKLKDLCSIFTDGDWIESKDQSETGIRLVQTGNIGVTKFLDKPNSKKWISKKTFERLNCTEVLSGDILISRLPEPAGRACIAPNIKQKMITAVDCTIVRIKPNYHPEFVVQYLSTQSYFNEVNQFLAGGTRQRISRSNLSDLLISFPYLKLEQEKIGMFFTKLDNLITLYQRKYENLVNIKGSMLEKMFPKDSSGTPKIRFKGFTDDWEQRKLGECFYERIESMPDGELISVTINDGIKKFSELGRHDNSNEDKSKYKKVCVGDIAYNSMRMWQGASGYSSYNGIVSPAYTVLSPNLGVDSKCMAYQFKLPEMIHTFKVNSQGITSDNWNLKYRVLSEIQIFIPTNIEEQHQIALFLEQLDNLITLYQRKLEKLSNIKKSMLEKMFV